MEGFINQSTLYTCIKYYHEPLYSVQLICESLNKKIQAQILPALLPESHLEAQCAVAGDAPPSGWAKHPELSKHRTQGLFGTPPS